MLLASQPVDIVMRRIAPVHRWGEEKWTIAHVLPVADADAVSSPVDATATCAHESITRLHLELHPDENDGYFENWIAPEPKVFVMWQMRGDQPRPLVASVSYAEGTRMLDSGDCTDGLAMPPAVHQWLGAYLKMYYRPSPRGLRGHRAA